MDSSTFWHSVATVMIGILVTILGFWAGVARKMVSREEIEDMIEDGPYQRDRQYIMDRLATNKETQEVLAKTIHKIADVLGELKVQIATLSVTLDALETRIFTKDDK